MLTPLPRKQALNISYIYSNPTFFPQLDQVTEIELATEAWMDDYEDCENVDAWTKYTILPGKITKAFFRAMKYLYFFKHT